MNKSEYRKMYIKTKPIFFRVLFMFGVHQIKILEKNSFGGGYNYKIRYLNPWNPLSYLYVIISMMVAFVVFFVSELIPELINGFKYK